MKYTIKTLSFVRQELGKCVYDLVYTDGENEIYSPLYVAVSSDAEIRAQREASELMISLNNSSINSNMNMQEFNIDEYKKSYCDIVDFDAEISRGQFITLGAGQAMTYLLKKEEAKALLLDESPDPADYPILLSTLGIDGNTLQEVATLILANDRLWRQIGSLIEHRRMLGKTIIKSCETKEGIESAYNSIIWPKPEDYGM